MSKEAAAADLDSLLKQQGTRWQLNGVDRVGIPEIFARSRQSSGIENNREVVREDDIDEAGHDHQKSVLLFNKRPRRDQTPSNKAGTTESEGAPTLQPILNESTDEAPPKRRAR